MAYNSEYKRISERIVKLFQHSQLLNGNYCDEIDVKLWMPDFNCVNITIFFDRLIAKYGDGLVLIDTAPCCISMLNLEYQSSGFRILDTIGDRMKGIVVLETSPDLVKDCLFIPNDWTEGFGWDAEEKEPPRDDPYEFLERAPNINYRQIFKIHTSYKNEKYILNFSVSGEFNLDMYFLPSKAKGLFSCFRKAEPMWIFSKGYCCK